MEEPATNGGLEERLRQLEPPYESEGERQVGRILDRYGVPFFYKQAVLVYDKDIHEVWHPNFMVFEYNGLVIEYHEVRRGMEVPADLQHRQAVYQANQIPAVFVYPTDLSAQNWQEKLYDRIQKTDTPNYSHGSPYRQ